MMEEAGIGFVFDKSGLSEPAKIEHAIQRLLTSSSMKIQANRYSDMLRSRLFAPRDLLVKHVHFAAEFGAIPAMTPKSVSMTAIEYFMIDVVFIVSLSVILSLIALRSFRCTRSAQKEKSQ